MNEEAYLRERVSDSVLYWSMSTRLVVTLKSSYTHVTNAKLVLIS